MYEPYNLSHRLGGCYYFNRRVFYFDWLGKLSWMAFNSVSLAALGGEDFGGGFIFVLPGRRFSVDLVATGNNSLRVWRNAC